MSESKQVSIEVPAETYERLSRLDSDRLDEVMMEAVKTALDHAEDADTRRDELRERMGLSGQDSEELVDGDSADDMTPVERRQKELRDKIRGGR